jgi:hypothetical protein
VNDLPTKPAAFFKISCWRSFGIRFIEGGGDRLEALDGIELYASGCQRGFVRAASSCVTRCQVGNKCNNLSGGVH